MKTVTVYTLSNCSTCRRATKWLREHDIGFVEKPIRESPPSPTELQSMLGHQHGAIRRLFNTGGEDYRAAGLAEKLGTMSTAQALALLAANGRLVRRPFLIGADVGLVGFNETEWARAFGCRGS